MHLVNFTKVKQLMLLIHSKVSQVAKHQERFLITPSKNQVIITEVIRDQNQVNFIVLLQYSYQELKLSLINLN
jgi:hypothetical protein